MAKVQTPNEKVVKPPVKKKNNHNSKNYKNTKRNYCILCRRFHMKHEAQEHVHSMLHHRELETVLGKDSFHECQACKASSMGLNEYARHISTAEHKAKLKSLTQKKVKALSLFKTLDKETMGQILERNKTLKKEKKAMKKKKKKLKQIAGQKRAAMQQGGSHKNVAVSNVARPEKSKQVNTRILKQGTYQQERNDAVVQNKENKVSSLQRPLYQRESVLQSQSGRLTYLSGEPAGRTLHCSNVRDQSTQSAQQPDNYSVKTESSQSDRLNRRPQGGVTNKPGQKSWPTNSQNDYYNKQYDGDFTSDQLPHNGAIIFGHGQNESTESSQPGQEGSAHHASASGSANAAPIRDVDISAMLRQIRRALGVREPCRADREARKQSSEAGVRVTEKESPTGSSCRRHAKEATLPVTSAAAPSVQSSQVNSPARASHSGVSSSSVAPPEPKQTTFRTTQGATQQCEKSSVSASNSNRALNSKERESQAPPDSQTSEPTSNITRRVRIAHRSATVQGGNAAGLKPTLNKVFSFSGGSSKSNWREVYEERKKQARGKSMPRFGIQLANPLSNQQSSTQAESDMTLSEGFHWESFPNSPSAAHWTGLPPPPQDTVYNDSRTETQSAPQVQEPLEPPGAAQEGCSRQTVHAVSVKMEQSCEDENGDLRASSGASKRKHNMYDDVSDKQSSGKKKKTKSNTDQGQMDQLLAVSLREDELSHSLQDLDRSLIQARSALQAAYTEVQRLLLLRQQFTAEINSLRAQRIEILQGMQGGYSGASTITERATTSPAGARLSPLPSSSAFPTQPSPTNPVSSISPLALTAMQVKQEIFQQSAAGQASQFAKMLPCNSETPQVPATQPVPLFPADLLPSLLLPSTSLAAPTTAVTSLKQLQSEPSVSPNVNQQTVRLASEEAQPADNDSEEEAGGNLSTEQVKGKEPAAEKSDSTSAPKRGQNASAAASDDDGDSESDASVKMMEPSNPVVIDIDESDNEDAPDDPIQQEPPEKSVSVEFHSSSTQVVQDNDAERKVQPTAVPVKDASVPSEGVENEEPSVGAFLNHTGPVHGLQVHEGRLYTCSGDNTARAYGLMNREYQAVFEGHTNKVNCLLVASFPNMPARLYTGSSDQTIRCYSIKTTKCLEQITLSDRVLCLHTAWNILFAGLANGSVASYDLKTLKQLDVFECHGPRGVSCLGTAQEGARRVLLVGSYDSTISVRDAKSGLLLRTLEGHTKTVLCMKVVNDLVFSGSSDTSVHAHNIHTGELVRIYKGHGHAVTSIVILGKVMVTACLDKLVRVYELQSHDRLQVYGGHNDMVMCMAVHKSVIYTGCYDGSVQAVKLNLMKNYRCWWQNCALIFGMAEHLLQHLVKDHSNPNLQSVKCRWRGCSTFFGTQQCVRQKLPEHMQNHAENDSKVQL
ncbi:zinc finger protein 106 isoform X2 [Epinephelus fuscoguttatus]|uniref:zinc finger protein 106 isoform X2 n=1 Tax=Epinephelus fuscoguttatus TaxID=293821 RepID=UPI0020D0E001|nr:zinc finger protein 106 isoform X2 [Epinephelus fuscoguttatus]